MSRFEDIHAERITGSLTMYDRLIFKGHLTRLYVQGAARAYLWGQGVPLKNFTPYAKATTAQIADHCRALATEADRPVIYLGKTRTWGGAAYSKENTAKAIAERDGITSGVICLISSVEPCMSVMVRRRHETGEIEIFRRQRACLHHYLYLIDDEFGFMHVRIQGWMPYEIQVYVNGREWLARQLDRARIGYLRHDNSLLRIDNLERASALCERFAHRAGLGCSTPSPAWLTPSCPASPEPASGATTGWWTRPRSPPTSCSPAGVSSKRSGPTSSATPASTWARRTCWASWAASSTRPWPPRSAPTPSGVPRAGGSATGWGATG